jgi:hypothetical protein
MSEQTAASETIRVPQLPEDARLLGYNRDVGFFLSELLGLVYVVQSGVVWALPRIATTGPQPR